MDPNLAIRWLTIPGTLLLLLDGLLVLLVARGICALSGVSSLHPVVRWLRRGVVVVLVVVASAWLLSTVGRLDSWGFLELHAVAGALLALARLWRPRPHRRGPGLSQVLFLDGRRHRTLLCVAGWIFVVLMLYALVIAIGTFAVNWDSQTYRLSRVGYWLQEKRISMDFANEPRLSYMPVNAELFMLWLTSFFPAGYPMVNLGQFLGGCLTLLSTWEMGRLSGLSREGRLLAVFLVLGIPVVFLEFPTSQSDLFTGGLLNAGLVFFWRSLRSRSRSDVVFSGLAVGLALGSKSTVLYWVPGLALWAAFLLATHRTGWRRAMKIVAISGALAVLAGGWKYADNFNRYGNPFAPSGEIARIHHQGGGDGFAAWRFIAVSHVWQLVQPDSNPSFLGPFLRGFSRRLNEHLETSAPDRELLAAYHGVRDAYAGDPVFEDIASYGLLVPALAVLGMMCDVRRSIRRSDSRARLRLAMAVSAAAFPVVLFHEMNLNPWNYRYFVILAPFVAIIAAAAWPQRPVRKAAMVAAVLVMLLQAYTMLDLQNRNVLGGWRSWFGRPEGTAIFESLAAQLSDSDPGARRVAVAVGENCWLSPYFRLPGQRKISFVSLVTLSSRYRSPGDFFRKEGFDALIADPGVFAHPQWPGVGEKGNGLPGPFAKVLYTRIR